MQVIVLDNGLGHQHLGHHQHMARHIIADARRFGCDTHLFALREATQDAMGGLDVRPVFTTPHYQSIGFDPLRAFGRVDRYLRDFAATGIQVARGDLLLLPTASVVEVYALLYWSLQRDQGLKFAFLFHTTAFPEMADPLESYLWAACRHLLTDRDPAQFWFGATTRPLAMDLEGRLDRPITLVPSVTWPPDTTPQPRMLSVVPRVGFLGGLRVQKGSLRIPDLTAQIRSRHPDWQVVIQAGDRPPSTAERPPFADDPAVEFVYGRLDDAALNRLATSFDVLICPYERGYYGQATSGLLALAASLGVATVVPSETTMADDLIGPARPLGGIYEGDSDAAIIDAVADLVARRGALAAEAPAAAARWRAHASGETMMRDLLAWAGVEAAISVTSTPVA